MAGYGMLEGIKMIGSARNQSFIQKAISFAGGATLMIALLFGTGVMYGADSAALGSETIPDNTPQAPGAAFTQTWTINNTGTTTWGSGYSLQYVSGNAGCNHTTSPLSVSIAPNTGVTWPVNCIAPAAAGTYREDWKLVGPSGTIAVGASSTVWVQIVVAAAGGGDAATLASETIPDNTPETAGAAFTQSWTMNNTGTTTWGSGYTLQYVSGNAGCNHTAPGTLSVTVAPNTSMNWTLSCTAPSTAGTYREDWKLVGPSGTIPIGSSSTVWMQIVVAGGGGGSDAATFVSETVPDDTQEAAGATYTQSWTFKNSGTTTWGSGYSLQYVSGNAGCNHGTSTLSVTIAPNTTVDWWINCAAPATAGVYREDWKLVGPSGAIAVGGYGTIWVQIVVTAGGGGDAATFVSQTIPDNTQEAAGASFTQSWTVQNSGTTTWGTGYSLQYVSGNAGCNHTTSALSFAVAPNASVSWNLNCAAPAAAGTYREDWKMVGPSGAIAVGTSSTIWVQVVVTGGG